VWQQGIEAKDGQFQNGGRVLIATIQVFALMIAIVAHKLITYEATLVCAHT
jgi:hypothetical protein